MPTDPTTLTSGSHPVSDSAAILAKIAAGAAVVSAAVIVAKPIRRWVFTPIFWIFRKLVGDPITSWVHSTVSGIVKEEVKRLDAANARRMAVVNANVTSVKEEVKTANTQSIANLIDATESRRIAGILPRDRTSQEAEHIASTPEPPIEE